MLEMRNLRGFPRVSPRLLLVLLALAIEGILLGLALIWALFRGIPVGASLYVDVRSLLWAAASTVLIGAVNIAAYGLALRRQVGAVVHFDRLVTDIFSESRLPDLLFISILAGIGEEVAFRGIIQAEIGVIGAGILFGAMHFVDRSLWFYTVWAAVVGIFFGYLYVWTGNLLVPITVHAAYDFIALVYIRYWRAADRTGE